MAVKLPIYMDNHATTPMDPRVLDAMLPYFTEKFGNAASRNHSFGWAGEEAVENARQQVASLINATAKEIIFTSGATESDNLMIKGVAEMYREKGNHIITQAIEHKAVLDTCKNLEKHGFEVTYLPVQKDGRVDPEDVRKAIKPTTILICIMYANNEIGAINPIQEIGKIAKERGIIFAVDGVQAVGKIPVDVQKDNIDLLAISAHKILRPQGCRRAVRAPPQSSRAALCHHRWWWSRARHALWHFECAGHRGTWQGLRDLPAGDGDGVQTASWPARAPEARAGSQARRSLYQWLHGASPARTIST